MKISLVWLGVFCSINDGISGRIAVAERNEVKCPLLVQQMVSSLILLSDGTGSRSM